MNTEKFFNKIRLIIREEIQHALQAELGTAPISNSKPIQQTKQRAVNEHKTTKPNVVSNAVFSTNPTLNSILQETAASGFQKGDFHVINEAVDINYNDYSEWPTMQSRNVSTQMPNIGINRSIIPSTDIDGRPINISEIDPSIANALTKDYRQLMKKIDNKKKGLLS